MWRAAAAATFALALVACARRGTRHTDPPAAGNATGAVASLPESTLARADVGSVEDLLQGRVPGLEVIHAPSGDIALRIRGTNSLLEEGEPLVILDGTPLTPLTLKRIRDIYEILAGLESTALRSVAERVTPGAVERMDELNQEMRRALDAGDFARFYDANLAFHGAYLHLSDNEELLHRIHTLKQRLYDFPRLPGFVPEWERASIEEHQAMIRALQGERVDEAADLLRDVHWNYNYQEPFVRRYYLAQEGVHDAVAP